MIFKAFKITLVGIIWSYIFIYCSNVLFSYLWGFNLLSPQSWKKIADYWNQGGAIREGKDYVFLLMIFLLVPFWIIGWKKLYRIDYIRIVISPFTLYNHFVINRCCRNGGRIALKNVGKTKKVKLEIKERKEAVKPHPEQDADRIRQAVKNKLNKSLNGSEK